MLLATCCSSVASFFFRPSDSASALWYWGWFLPRFLPNSCSLASDLAISERRSWMTWLDMTSGASLVRCDTCAAFEEDSALRPCTFVSCWLRSASRLVSMSRRSSVATMPALRS